MKIISDCMTFQTCARAYELGQVINIAVIKTVFFFNSLINAWHVLALKLKVKANPCVSAFKVWHHAEHVFDNNFIQ